MQYPVVIKAHWFVLLFLFACLFIFDVLFDCSFVFFLEFPYLFHFLCSFHPKCTGLFGLNHPVTGSSLRQDPYGYSSIGLRGCPELKPGEVEVGPLLWMLSTPR